MKKVRIALGSNDGKSIFPNHMGMAKDFYIFDLFEDGGYYLIDKRKNTSPGEEGKHGLAEKMKACMEIFEDSDVLVGRILSPNFVKIAANTKFQPVVTKIDSVSNFMKEMAKSFDKIYTLVEHRENGERPKDILKIGWQ